jgi:Transmembrane exosortase (Exosortase_EpsH)
MCDSEGEALSSRNVQHTLSQRAPTAWRAPATMTVAALVVLVCYAPSIAALAETWSGSALYSFGFAVPFISGYIAWTKAPALRRAAVGPDYGLGIPVTLFALGVLIVGRLGAFATVQQASFVIALVGLLLVFFGREVTRILWFPLAYLLLMVPVWDIPVGLLQWPSRILSAGLAVTFRPRSSCRTSRCRCFRSAAA